MPGGVVGEIVANFVEGEIEFVLGGGGFGRSGDDESPMMVSGILSQSPHRPFVSQIKKVKYVEIPHAYFLPFIQSTILVSDHCIDGF